MKCIFWFWFCHLLLWLYFPQKAQDKYRRYRVSKFNAKVCFQCCINAFQALELKMEKVTFTFYTINVIISEGRQMPTRLWERLCLKDIKKMKTCHNILLAESRNNSLLVNIRLNFVLVFLTSLLYFIALRTIYVLLHFCYIHLIICQYCGIRDINRVTSLPVLPISCSPHERTFVKFWRFWYISSFWGSNKNQQIHQFHRPCTFKITNLCHLDHLFELEIYDKITIYG